MCSEKEEKQNEKVDENRLFSFLKMVYNIKEGIYEKDIIIYNRYYIIIGSLFV